MDKVIFLSEHLAARPSRPLPTGASADIIIFQGVRFERLTDDMIDQASTRPRRLPSLQNHATAEALE